MIKGFEQPHRTEPIEFGHWQGTPAVSAGLIAGVVLLILPHASPWEGLTSFTPALMGRVVPQMWELGIFMTIVLHLALAIIYGVLISFLVMHIRQLAAVLAGGVGESCFIFSTSRSSAFGSQPCAGTKSPCSSRTRCLD